MKRHKSPLILYTFDTSELIITTVWLKPRVRTSVLHLLCHITHNTLTKHTNTQTHPDRLPLILVALSQFPRPQSVVEVAWQPFSQSPRFGVDGGTSA